MTITTLVLLGMAALLVGLAKTAIGGVARISVAIFALAMPTRESTAFFGGNLCKLPFSAGLGLFTADALWRTVAFAPFVMVVSALALVVR